MDAAPGPGSGSQDPAQRGALESGRLGSRLAPVGGVDGVDGGGVVTALAAVDDIADPAGNDTIDAADGVRDIVDCGKGGNDAASIDAGDTTYGCETRVKAAALESSALRWLLAR